MAPGVSTIFLLLTFISSFSPIRAAPTPIPRTELVMRQDSNSTTNSTSSDFKTQNALDAQKLNAQFATIKVGDACQDGSQACVNSAFAQCVSGTWALSPCASGTTCVALPLVNKAGTSLSCDTESDAESRFSAAGVSGGITGSGNTTTSTGAVGNSTTTDDDDDSDDCDDGDDSSNDTVSTMDGDGEDCDDEDDTATSTASAVSKTVSAFATSTSTISSSISSVGTAIGDQVTATTILLNFPSVSSDASAASTITLKLSSASISASVASDAAVAAATTIKLNRRQLTFISSAAAAPTPASESVALPSSVLPPGIGSVSLTTISLVGSVASAVSSDTVPSAIPSLSASPFGSSPAAVVSSPAAVSSESPSSVGVLPSTVTVTVVSTLTVAVPAATISSSALPGVLPSPSISISASVLPSNPISNAPVLTSQTVSVLSVPLSTVVSEPISATSFLPSVSAASVLASQTASVATNPFSVSAPALSSESATLSQALTSPAVSTVLPIASVNTLISTSTSVSVTPSATAAGFSFSLQPTAASSLAGNNVNIGQVTSVDIATLLTATIA